MLQEFMTSNNITPPTKPTPLDEAIAHLKSDTAYDEWPEVHLVVNAYESAAQSLTAKEREVEQLKLTLSGVSRLIDFADRVNQGESDQKVASEASFKEAVAYTNLEMVEKERTTLLIEVERLVRSADYIEQICIKYKSEHEKHRIKWSKGKDRLNENYWEGRRDGINDVILTIKMLETATATTSKEEQPNPPH